MDIYTELTDFAKNEEIILSPTALHHLEGYFYGLIKENQNINLTGHKEEKQMVADLFADSLAILKFIPLESGMKILDVGCGGGFPGMVLKFARPEIRLSLMDSCSKKLNFIKKNLGGNEPFVNTTPFSVKGIEFLPYRAEELGRDDKYRERFDMAVTKALAPLSVSLELCVPFVKVGGKFIAWKGKGLQEELNGLEKALKQLGVAPPRLHEFYNVMNDHTTVFCIFEKIKPTGKIFPRSYSTIKKKNLKEMKETEMQDKKISNIKRYKKADKTGNTPCPRKKKK